MRKFLVNVDGKEYEVAVEELTANELSGFAAAPVAARAPAAAPAPQEPAPASASIPMPEKVVTPPAHVTGGKCEVESPMPGTILEVKISVGDTVKAGDTMFVLEAMKMENEILAPENGKVLSVNTARGASVNSGDVLSVLG